MPSSRPQLQPFNTSVRLLAALPPAAQARVDRACRQRLKRVGFSNDSLALLAGATPFAAARRLEAGESMQDVLNDARSAGRRLARLDLPPDRIPAAIGTCDQAASETLPPAPDGESLLIPYLHLQIALATALTEGFAAVWTAETQMFEHMLRFERHARDHASVLREFAAAISKHFGASSFRLFEIASADPGTDEPLAPVGEAVTATPKAARGLRDVRYVRSASDPLLLGPQEGACFWSAPLAACGPVLWVLQLAFSEPNPILSRDRWMLEAARLRCEVTVERVVRERRLRERALNVIQVEELERRHLSRELHDEPAQSLAVVRLHLELIEGAVPDHVRGQLTEARSVLEKTILDVRRLISELSPVVLPQLGVAAAIRQLVSRFRRSYRARVALQIGKLPEINHQYGLVLYRTLQECFSNISRHSGARNINVSLSAADRVLRLQVEDDGVGFHVRERMSRPECFGLVGIRERVTLLGGYLDVQSTPKSGGGRSLRSENGTRIYIELPLTEENPSQM